MSGFAVHSTPSLTTEQLAAVAELERRVVDHDGGRLKLEWRTLRNRSGDAANDLLVTDGATVVGFAGLYKFGASTTEIAGMVDPASRRQGIGRTLAEQALRLLAARGEADALLVCPRTPDGGSASFARTLGGQPDHSEHAMLLDGAPADGPQYPGVVLRPGSPDDSAAVRTLLLDGFGFDDDEIGQRLRDRDRNMVVELEGAIVGYAGVTLDEGRGGVYGFVIDSRLRGRGIGRDVLRRICCDLRGRGAREVGLEVAVDNEHALGLYTSLGFRPVITEDYFRIAVPAMAHATS